MKFNDIVNKIILEHTKQQLFYQFKCTDADEDGIFEYTPWGEIDSTEFARFIEQIEEHEISLDSFKERFVLPPDDNILQTDYPLSFYFDGKWLVIFDGDTHFVYSI